MATEIQESFKQSCESSNLKEPQNNHDKNIPLSIENYEKIYCNTLSDDLKSTIMNRAVNFQGSHIQLKQLIKDHSEFVNHLNIQQINEITSTNIPKISKSEDLDVKFFIKRGFIQEPINAQTCRLLHHCHIHNMKLETFSKAVQEFIKNYLRYEQDLRAELQKYKVVIIADDPGSGKTTILRHLARKYKEDDGKLWISYIDARLSSEIFKNMKDDQDWNYECLTDMLVDILGLTGIEVPIFKQLLKDNEVILLWDHIDEKFQSVLINFACNIRQLTEVQQVITTRFRYSEKLSQKFNRTPYKFFPYTTVELDSYFCTLYRSVRTHHFGFHALSYCEIFYNPDSYYKIIISVVEMLVTTRAKMDVNIRIYSLLEKMIEKFGDLEIESEMSLSQILQVHALKLTFGDDHVDCLTLVKKYEKLKPEIPSIHGLYATNYEDNSIEFQSFIFPAYFTAQFIFENVLIVNTMEIKKLEAQQLVHILALIATPSKSKFLYYLIRDVYSLNYEKYVKFKDFQVNIIKIIKKTQCWSKFAKCYKFHKKIGNDCRIYNMDMMLDDKQFWSTLLTEIKNYYWPDKKDFEPKKQDKNETKVKERTRLKGMTKVRKMNQNCEILHQLSEYFEDKNNN